MKRNNLAIAIGFVLVLLAACQASQKSNKGISIGPLHISQEHPAPGKTVDIRITPEDSTLKALHAYWIYLVNDDIYTQDLKLDEKSGTYTGSISVPDSATLLAIMMNTSENSLFAEQDYEWVFQLYKNGEPLPGTMASEAYLYDGFGQRFFGWKMPDSSKLKLLRDEFDKNPTATTQWGQFYARLLSDLDKGQAETFVKNQVKAIAEKKDKSLDDYNALIDFSRFLKQKNKVDSLEKVVITAFPNSTYAQIESFKKFRKSHSLEEKETIYKKYMASLGENAEYGDRMASALASAYLRKQNSEKFQSYSDKIHDLRSRASLYNNIAWGSTEGDNKLSPEKALELSKESMSLLKKAEKNLNGKPDYLSPSLYRVRLNNSYGMYADTYALLLYKQGNLKEAIKYQKLAVDNAISGDVAERYLKYLLEDSQTDKVLKLSEEFIKEGNATNQSKAYFKKAYVATNGSSDGFNEKLETLEDIARERAKEALRQEMVKEPAPSFTLQDLAGNEVDLASLKGKTVILDFWATWCGPCKASFPGMVKVLDKYKDRKDVVFLFVNTFERSPSLDKRIEKVGGFIDSKGYPFHVILDQQKKDSRNFQVAGDYGITGIPTKIFIGPEGNTRYKKVGYSGNNAQMEEEIELLLELIQA